MGISGGGGTCPPFPPSLRPMRIVLHRNSASVLQGVTSPAILDHTILPAPDTRECVLTPANMQVLDLLTPDG